MKRLDKKYILLALSVAVLLAFSCSDMDDTYDEFLTEGEKIYPAKADSAKVYSGRNRLQLSWLILADPKVTKAKVFWNSRKESTEIAIEKTSNVDTVKVMLNGLAEGSYVFEIITYDKQDHASMVTEVVGNVYGAEYESTLLIRPVVEAYTKHGAATLRFGATSEQAVATEIEYTDNTGTLRSLSVPSDALSFQLPNYVEGSSFRHRTVFKPDTTAIDMFYTNYQEVKPEVGVLIRVPYAKSTWQVIALSSEEPNNSRLASKLIDNDINSFWIARYSSNPTAYPNHFVTVDMKVVQDVDGFTMVQKTGDRKIKTMEVQVSNDNSTWTSLGIFDLQNLEKTEQIFRLPSRQSFRYFKVIPKSGYDSQPQPGLAEFGAFFLE